MPAVLDRFTLADLDALPATLSPTEAAKLLGVGRSTFYEALRAGTAPVQPLQIGGRTVVPTTPLLRAIGYLRD